MAFPWANGCWNHWNGKVTCPNWYLQILDKGQRRATLEWAVNYKRIWGTALTPWFDLSWTTSQRVFIPLHTSDCIVPSTFLCNAKSCQSLLSFWSFSSWARVNVGRSPLLGVGGMGGSPSIYHSQWCFSIAQVKGDKSDPVNWECCFEGLSCRGDWGRYQPKRHYDSSDVGIRSQRQCGVKPED